MADTASLFSTTTTLLDTPLHTLLADGTTDTAAPASVSWDECSAVLVVNHNRFVADTALLSRCGLPASYDRASAPNTSRTGLSKLNAKKRLQVQFTTAFLRRDIVERLTIPTDSSDLRSRREPLARTRGRRQTMLELIHEDVVCMRTRRITSAAQRLLFHASDVLDTTLFYPAHTLVKTPPWAVQKTLWSAVSGSRSSSSGTGGDATQFASASAKWATLVLTSPVVAGSADAQLDAASRAEREKKMLGLFSETDDDILARMVQPSDARETLLDRVLLCLERRGAIWCKAGHICRPSMMNSDPTIRPQFVVMGLFPDPFLDRCKAYCRGGASGNGSNCLPPESAEPTKSKRAVLVVSAPADLAQRGTGTATQEDDDLLNGWHVRVTPEPFKQGTAKDMGLYASTAGGSGSAMAI